MPTHWNVLFFSIYILFKRSALLPLVLDARAGDEKFLHPYPHVASLEISSGLSRIM